jgi:hypothetical protein
MAKPCNEADMALEAARAFINALPIPTSGATGTLARLQQAPTAEALRIALGYVERFEDVNDGDYGQPEPNEAMWVASKLREAIAAEDKPCNEDGPRIGRLGNQESPSPALIGGREKVAGGLEALREDYYPSHEALCELVGLIAERDALNGGGPNFRERWNRAVLAAEELVRVEP